MKMQWTEDLSVGIGEIDSQHREFIRLMAEMPEELSASYDKEKAVELILFLESYADRHFKTEEMFMSVYGYPQINAHKALHDKFRAEIAVMRGKAEKENEAKVIMELNTRIFDWFVEHIRATDTKLAAFLRPKMK